MNNKLTAQKSLTMPRILGVGRETLSISAGDMELAVDSKGANLIGIFPKGMGNILYYDEANPKRRGIPICMPWFGPLEAGKLNTLYGEKTAAQHGFFRDSEFVLEVDGDSSIIAHLVSNDSTKKLWPFEFASKIRFEIDKQNQVNIYLAYTNLDKYAVTLAPGLHPYFTVEDPNEVIFNSDAKKANNNKSHYKPVKIADEFEMVKAVNGTKYWRIKGQPDLHIKGHTFGTTLIRPGFDNRVIFLMYDPQVFNRLAIWRETEDAGYICIEPGFEQNAINKCKGVMVKPGDTWETKVMIGLGKYNPRNDSYTYGLK